MRVNGIGLARNGEDREEAAAEVIDRERRIPKRKLLAADLERRFATAPPSRDLGAAPTGEALAMLARRGFFPKLARPDLPFPGNLDEVLAVRLSARLGHYAFRLFLRAAILSGGPFEPAAATRYLTTAQATALADELVQLDLAVATAEGRYQLKYPARSFGGTLEWYLARELRRRLGFDVATALKLRGKSAGGDLDVVAAAEGKLIYIELKSSPPKYLSRGEVSAFFGRLRALRPDVSVFAMDTALRLSDKVVPMLEEELPRGAASVGAKRIQRELWALTPHVYAVHAKPDLVGNVCRAISLGLLALTPEPP